MRHEDRGVENEDIEYLEVKGPSPCIEPSPIATTIRGDEEGSADTPHPYCCKLFVGATCVKIHISKSGHCKKQRMKGCPDSWGTMTELPTPLQLKLSTVKVLSTGVAAVPAQARRKSLRPGASPTGAALPKMSMSDRKSCEENDLEGGCGRTLWMREWM